MKDDTTIIRIELPPGFNDGPNSSQPGLTPNSGTTDFRTALMEQPATPDSLNTFYSTYTSADAAAAAAAAAANIAIADDIAEEPAPNAVTAATVIADDIADYIAEEPDLVDAAVAAPTERAEKSNEKAKIESGHRVLEDLTNAKIDTQETTKKAPAKVINVNGAKDDYSTVTEDTEDTGASSGAGSEKPDAETNDGLQRMVDEALGEASLLISCTCQIHKNRGRSFDLQS